MYLCIVSLFHLVYLRELKVSSRHVLLRGFDKDGFIIKTDIRSRKANEMVNISILYTSYTIMAKNIRHPHLFSICCN